LIIEKYKNIQKNKIKSDIYSLGVIFYELTHGPGVTPFAGKYESDVIMGIMRNKYTIRKGTNKSIIRIIHSCLQLSKRNRITTNQILSEIEIAESALYTNFVDQDLIVYNDRPLPDDIGSLKPNQMSSKRFTSFIIVTFLIIFIVIMVYYMYRLGLKTKMKLHNSRRSSIS